MRGGRTLSQLASINLILLFIFVTGHHFSIAQEQLSSGIIHFPVKNGYEGQNISIEAKIEHPNLKIEYMRLYYRQKGQSNFQFIEMREQLNNYVIEIPASDVKMPGVEYFIMGILQDHSMITSPAANPYYAPYEITLNPGNIAANQPHKQKKPLSQNSALASNAKVIEPMILSPEPESQVIQDEVLIAISFLGETEKLNLKSIKIFIDEKKFTGRVQITPHMLSCTPKNLTPGLHQVRLELADKHGKRLSNVQWQFSVMAHEKQARKGKKVPLSGNMFAEWKNEDVSHHTLTTQNVGANFRGKYGPIEYRGLFFVTSREKPQFQPRNRMLLEVGTSWLGVKLGDTTPRFNELLLWGQRVRGIEAYLKLGFFNVELVQGETNRRIKGIPFDVIKDPITGKIKYVVPNTDSVVTSTTGIYRYGTFAQNLLALRPSFGSGKYFQLGFNLVKVKDDTATSTYGSHPKDNIVVGPDFLLALFNHRIELKASAAFSLLANDISHGAISKAELDSALEDIPFDPSEYAKYFIINTSLIPLNPSKLNSLAYQASFRFNFLRNNFNVIYKTIGSEYYSLANPYVRKDIQGFSLDDRIQLYQNQIYLNLGYDKYIEGRSFKDDDEETSSPTNYHGLTIGISIYPRNNYLPKLNLNWKNYDRDNDLDTTQTMHAVNYQNTDVSVQLGYDVQLFGLNHNLNFSYITTDRNDGFKRKMVNLSNDIQLVSARTTFQIPLTTVITYATNRNRTAGGLHRFNYDMFNLSADYYVLNRRLCLTGGLGFTSASGLTITDVDSSDDQMMTLEKSWHTDYKRTAINLGGNFQINPHHFVLLDLSFINFNDKKSKTYNDSIMRLRYEFRY